VLELTDAGQMELKRLREASQTEESSPQNCPESLAPHATLQAADDVHPAMDDQFSPSPAADLDRLVTRMLLADREEAQALVESLRLYHPAEVAARLAARFDASGDVRERSRAAWAAGELCGQHGLALLARCTRSETPNVRRLAASALGKVAGGARTAAIAHREGLTLARQALEALVHDAAPQVRQYAEKALAEFPRHET
jgi:HEAT repeat protein